MNSIIFTLVAASLLVLNAVHFAQFASPCPTDGSCALPDCRCSSTTPPEDLEGPDLPQMVFISFDAALSSLYYPFYEEVLFGRTNPNGAPISATFFVNHEYSNYSLIHDVWRRGHEIAAHSISPTTTVDYWREANLTVWAQEIVQQRRQIATFANIPASEIRGMRAPFLQIGGNVMYGAIAGDLDWECSRGCSAECEVDGIWPYTNDYSSTQGCDIGPCPDQSFPGFWSVPILDLKGDNGAFCALLDECVPLPMTRNETFNLLHRNFLHRYNTNKAPFNIFTRAGFFVQDDQRPEFEERKQGLIQFLDFLKGFNDVFVISISRGIEWMKSPTSMEFVYDFEPWMAPPARPDNCPFPRNCRYTNSTWERYMASCVPCPLAYPWVFNPLGSAAY